MELMARHGAIRATLDRATRSAEQAKGALSVFPDSPIKACLLGVADYTVSRAR
jgi:octaprenyl-diphosphate synthase